MNEQQDPGVEARLRTWYAGFEPEESGRATNRVASSVSAARDAETALGRPRARWPRLFLAAGLSAIVALLVIVPVVLAPVVGPGPSPSRSAQPTSSGSPHPSALPSVPIPTPSPTSEWQAITAAAVDDAGPIRTGGMWAVTGTTLRLSFDGGSTWTSTHIPARDPDALVPATAVLDSGHAWTLRAGPGSTTGSSDSVVTLLVYRTADGGETWQSASIPGNFFEKFFFLTFVDSMHGFLGVYSTGTEVVVYRTSDGGATWTAWPARRLFWTISVSDASTLWSSSPGAGAMCVACGRPLLEVSRDAGATWSDVALPGFEGKLSGDLLGAAAPPSFVDPSTGYFAVNRARTDSTLDGASEIFRTTDAGRTWTLVSTAPYWIGNLIVLDARHWMAATFDAAPNVVATDDGGRSWGEFKTDLPGFAAGAWFVDSDHGATVVAPGQARYPAAVLEITADGGATWQYADFGD